MNWRDSQDHKLVEWIRNLNQFVDEGVEPLSSAAIDRATRLFAVLREVNSPVFTMVPDVNGGIVVEYKIGDKSYVFNVWEDGRIQACVFEGTKLINKARG